MAIQVSEKKNEIKLPQGLDALFHFAVVLFIIVGASYFFVLYLTARAEAREEQIEQKIEETKAQIPEKEELERTAQRYFNLIEDFKFVLEKHHLFSLLFSPFEEMTHPGVTIVSAEFNLDEGIIIVGGVTDNLVAVGQQFHALKNKDFILNVNLDNLNVKREDDIVLEREEILFSFMLSIDRDLFKFETKDDNDDNDNNDNNNNND